MRPDVAERAVLTTSMRAMACDIEVRIVEPSERARAALARAVGVFTDVDRACSRFRSDSDLSQVNANPAAWHEVGRECFQSIVEAHAAYRRTSGRFDPRIHDDLVAAGYDHSVTQGPLHGGTPRRRPDLEAWEPELDWRASRVRVGGHRLDLGGIAKGLAVRWATHELIGAGAGHLVEAGGDLAVAGVAPDGAAWRVAVEDPATGETAAVLALTDLAVATSSTRARSWDTASGRAHHLIDPDTGLPGGAGLRAVTVVDTDPALAEVWTKQLFLCGRERVDAAARLSGLAALWFDDDGAMAHSPAMAQHLMWTR